MLKKFFTSHSSSGPGDQAAHGDTAMNARGSKSPDFLHPSSASSAGLQRTKSPPPQAPKGMNQQRSEVMDMLKHSLSVAEMEKQDLSKSFTRAINDVETKESEKTKLAQKLLRVEMEKEGANAMVMRLQDEVEKLKTENRKLQAENDEYRHLLGQQKAAQQVEEAKETNLLFQARMKFREHHPNAGEAVLRRHTGPSPTATASSVSRSPPLSPSSVPMSPVTSPSISRSSLTGGGFGVGVRKTPEPERGSRRSPALTDKYVKKDSLADFTFGGIAIQNVRQNRSDKFSSPLHGISTRNPQSYLRYADGKSETDQNLSKSTEGNSRLSPFERRVPKSPPQNGLSGAPARIRPTAFGHIVASVTGREGIAVDPKPLSALDATNTSLITASSPTKSTISNVSSIRPVMDEDGTCHTDTFIAPTLQPSLRSTIVDRLPTSPLPNVSPNTTTRTRTAERVRTLTPSHASPPKTRTPATTVVRNLNISATTHSSNSGASSPPGAPSSPRVKEKRFGLSWDTESWRSSHSDMESVRRDSFEAGEEVTSRLSTLRQNHELTISQINSEKEDLVKKLSMLKSESSPKDKLIQELSQGSLERYNQVQQMQEDKTKISHQLEQTRKELERTKSQLNDASLTNFALQQNRGMGP